MRIRLTSVLLGLFLSYSANAQVTKVGSPEESAIKFIQNSAQIQAQAKALCGSVGETKYNAIIAMTNDDSSYQVLVIETPYCAFLGPYLSAIVRVQRKFDANTATVTFIAEAAEQAQLPYVKHPRPSP